MSKDQYMVYLDILSTIKKLQDMKGLNVRGQIIKTYDGIMARDWDVILKEVGLEFKMWKHHVEIGEGLDLTLLLG